MKEAEPEVLMLRNVLATTAHDLGGLASALLLRADVLEHGSSDTTGRAMRSIATELRVLGQQLRALREDEVSDTLAPLQHGSALWSARVTRFGVGLLPRGSAIACTVDDADIPQALAHPLWKIALSLLGAIGAQWPTTRITVEIGGEQKPEGTALALAASTNGQPLDLADAMQGAWWQWAVHQAASDRITLIAERNRIVIDTQSTRSGDA
jgi:hypothetical protein